MKKYYKRQSKKNDQKREFFCVHVWLRSVDRKQFSFGINNIKKVKNVRTKKCKNVTIKNPAQITIEKK